MPYPLEMPINKHDLLCPPSDNYDGLKFTTTSAIFEALNADVPKDLEQLCPVYTYRSDALEPNLSRSLLVIGFADTSLKMVRQLLGDDDVPPCLKKSTIAVKRADGEFRSALRPQDLQNSSAFAEFMRSLHRNDVVAILAQDKYHRFGILTPSEEMKVTDVEGEGYDYYANVFVGEVEAVKAFVVDNIDSEITMRTSILSGNEESLWQPPISNTDRSDEGNGSMSLWKPPHADNDKNDDEGFWKPPTDSGSFVFGSSVNLWHSGTDVESADNRKRKRVEDALGFHEDAGAAAADAFYSGLTRSLETRADSRIYHMRSFNGWVKATQIQELDPKTKTNQEGPIRVLDLACGKGGDLGKWILTSRGIGNYVGIDVARGSLSDAAIRARKMRHKLKRCTFTCADLGADVPGRLKSSKHKHMQKLLTWTLQNEPPHATEAPNFRMTRGGGISMDDKFDVVSIQFAIHYMMSSRSRARRFFQTVSQLLEIGGNLIATTIDARMVLWHLMNLGIDLHCDSPDWKKVPAIISVGGGACKISFEPEIVKRVFKEDQNDPKESSLYGLEYTFTLVEGSDHEKGVGNAVNLPEWLTPLPVLESLANEAGLEMEYAQNFHEFYSLRSDPIRNVAAHQALYNMKVLNRNGSISDEEWEISRMYVAVKFRKVKEATMLLEDEESLSGSDDEVNQDIDPAVKAKLLPMALMKAKKAVGAEAWESLSSEEKTSLIDTEVRLLALAKQ